MKKNLILAVTGSMILLCVLAVAAVAFIAGGIRSQARDLERFLPPPPVAQGVFIKAANSKVFNRFATRQFLFTAVNATTASEAAERFESQFLSAGWEKASACSDGSVSSSSWRHREKFEGSLQLAFTTLKLSDENEYLGTMVNTFASR